MGARLVKASRRWAAEEDTRGQAEARKKGKPKTRPGATNAYTEI